MTSNLYDMENTINDADIEKIYHQYFDDICTFLNYYTHDRQLIEDTIQDIFVRLWEEKNSINIFYIKSYLYKAARNRILNHLRDEKNRSQLAEEWAVSEIEKLNARECVNMAEFSKQYRQAVSVLPEKCRKIFLMSRESDKTYRDIAEELEISSKTVEAQMSIALKKIKEYILSYYTSSDPKLLLIVTIAIDQLFS